MFKKAQKSQSKARIAIIGPSGSGKTYTALTIASAMGQRIALIDTENGSASKYADIFDFDTANLTSYHPDNYIRMIREAESAGYDVLIIDSLSHAWSGPDGVLELVDKAAVKYRDNRFSAWRDASPIHNKLVHTIITANMHIIATMRSKTEWVTTTDEHGRMKPQKVGLAPIQRENIEYEFDIVMEMDIDHNLRVTKTRCRELDNYIVNKPDKSLGVMIKNWLEEGLPPDQVPATPQELKKLMDVAAQAGISVDQLKAIVLQKTGKTSSHELTSADVALIVAELMKVS